MNDKDPGNPDEASSVAPDCQHASPQQIFQGIIPPMITPLRARDELDVAGLERLIEHILTGGVHGLFILGTTGEGPSLSYRIRSELIDRTCRQVAGRRPVLVGITDTAVVESLALAAHAERAGAAALVSSTPYYLPCAQSELAGYFERLVAAIALPLLLYNTPAMTKVAFGIGTLRRLAELPGIAGVKDSSEDPAYFSQLLGLRDLRPDWTFLVGPEGMLADTLKQGGHGGVNGGANVWPRLYVDLYQAVLSGDTAREQMLQQQLTAFDRIYRIGRNPAAFIQGLKCSASLMGLCDDCMAEPFSRLSDTERQQVSAVLAELGLFDAGLPIRG